MSKIEKLTPEQERELSLWRERYLSYATDGKRIDRDALQSAMNEVYAVIGKPAPRLFIFESPAACVMAIKIFQLGRVDELGDQLWDQLGVQLWDQLGVQLGVQLRDQLGVQLRDQLWDQLGDQLWVQLGDQLWVQLRDQLWDQLGVQRIYNPNYLWGSQDLYWISWAKFGQHIGAEFTEKQSKELDIMERIGVQCEWWWPFNNVVFASQKPTTVKFDEQRRLHCENGPAVAYEDGYSLYSWHGTRLPAEWVEQRATIAPTVILKCENVEQRAAGLQCIGYHRVFDQLNGRVIHDSGDAGIGELVEITIPGLATPGRFLRAQCPRNGIIFEGVPTLPSINTAYAAQAWREGLTADEWTQPPVRT